MTAARPEPFWFGDQRLRCFGMLHRPVESNGRGVVVCNALGFEGLLAYRPFRHLADRLVARGFTVLRFDYAGTGDSVGGEWEPGCVKAWLGSISEAVEVMRAEESVEDVQLVGFRFGATLALLHAAEHPGISGLALWAPCQNGKSYARELSALARLSSANRPTQRVASDWFPEDSLEAVGFEFTSSTLDDMREVDVRTLGPASPAPAAFVLDRDDAPESSDLVTAMATTGTVVDHDRMTGYLDFVTEDETTSTLPNEALDRLAEWLERTDRHPEPAPRRAVSVGSEVAVDDAQAGHMFPPGSAEGGCRERAVWITDSLFGIVGRPDSDGPFSRRVVLILNTGSANRAGPGRLHVTLARHWASLGFTVVRVDLGGTGDSVAVDPVTENRPYDDARLTDSVDIVTWIRRELDCDELTVFGVCSGAYQGYRIALDGAPVDRIVLVNQLIFARNGLDALDSGDNAVLSANLVSRGLGNRDRWKRLLTGEDKIGEVYDRFRELVASGAFSGFTQLAKASARNVAGRLGMKQADNHEIARELRQLADAKIDVVYVFAADEPGSRFVRVMGGPGVERLVADGRVKIIEIDGGDHVFSPPGSRQRLIEAATAVLTGADRTVAPAAASTFPHPRS